MKPTEFSSEAPGKLVSSTSPRGQQSASFVPDFLPPALQLSSQLASLAEQAGFALGNLNGVGARLSNPVLFAQPFLRQEAVASTRIEGTRTDLQQLVLFEAENNSDPSHDEDNRETLNYVRALNMGWNNPDMAVATRHGILSLHQTLMESVRGANRNPGNFRTSVVYIGGVGTDISGARFVPPPSGLIPELIDNLLTAANETYGYPRLVHLAMLHYQFETIHPFEDGNGRTGRLMIPLYLKHWGLLDQPLLSISTYFEQNRRQYIDLLYRVSTTNAWEEWIAFFLTGIRDHSFESARKAHRILNLQDQLRQTYQTARSPHVLPILEHALASIAVTVDELEPITQAKRSTLYGILRQLEGEGVIRRLPLRNGRHAFVLIPLVDILLSAE